MNKPLLCEKNRDFIAVATKTLKVRQNIPILNLNNIEEVAKFILNHCKVHYA